MLNSTSIILPYIILFSITFCYARKPSKRSRIDDFDVASTTLQRNFSKINPLFHTFTLCEICADFSSLILHNKMDLICLTVYSTTFARQNRGFFLLINFSIVRNNFVFSRKQSIRKHL